MELTENHIAQLYQFTQDHYVEWYDLQTELVDHLAADIEEIWQENPAISFEAARDISFKKFGIFGFGEVVEEKQKALSKSYWKLIWKEFLLFFKLPKLVLTGFFFVGTYLLFSYFNNGLFIFPLYILTVGVYPTYKILNLHRKTNKRNRITNKKWLLDGALFQTSMFPYFILFCPFPNWIDVFYKPEFTINQLLFLSITFVLFNLFFYISIEIVRPNMQNNMAKLFPEYQFL